MRKHHPMLFLSFMQMISMCIAKQVSKQKRHYIPLKSLADCKLSANEQKTKIVYCGLNSRLKDYSVKSFGFLEYTFRRRLAQSHEGKRFVGFLPAISQQAMRSIRQIIRGWRIHHRTFETIRTLAKSINPYLCGWVNYYDKFYRSEMQSPLLLVEYYLKKVGVQKV